MARSARAKKPQPLEHRLLLTATFCLLAGGAVMVYSASSARTLLQGQGDGTAYLVKYIAYGAAGLVVMHLLSRHGLVAARRWTRAILLAAGVLLVLVLIPGIGVEVNGARRWIGAALAGAGVPLHECGDLAAAVGAARAAAQPGEVVLLSPACASYDQYRSFEERGEHFRALVEGG